MPTLLLFGLSDILPVAGGDELRWPDYFLPELEQAIGEPVRMERRRLSWDARDPRDYLRQAIEEVDPDVISLGLTVHPFAAARVQTQVDQRFGRTVGRAARKLEQWTARPSKHGRTSAVSLFARRLARKTVGTATLCTREEIDRSVENAFRLLSQSESVPVVVRPEPPPSPLVARENPPYGRILEAFNAYWEPRARARHFIWAPAPPRDSRHWLRDGVHPTVEGHRERAMVLLPAFLEAFSHLAEGTSPAAGRPRLTAHASAARGEE